MLKIRVVGVVLVKNGWVVQSIGFSRYLPVGTLNVTVEYLDKWGIDEIIILDIDATAIGMKPVHDRIKSVSTYSHTPLSVGGGISTLSDIENLIRVGADKVVINSAFLANPSILERGAKLYGSQCIIASIDAVKLTNGSYGVFSRDPALSNRDLVKTAKIAQDNGAGEIFLNSVEKDGAKSGLDIDMFRIVKESVDIPVILCGGVGRAEHLIQGAKAGADAVAASNFFHFTELSVILAKQKMIREGLNIRLDSHVTFSNAKFDNETDRLTRLGENELDSMRFEYIPEEVI